ncbi:hypothetical protein B5X24_HaOG214514 [Helicoverpa armigera]|uniref:Uncharacterized protein n=1 Tax=Helicoverpa armigera TaxID=29058 RepID=A0A2W1BDK1_HELAM|nr:hypothetical protein B5X24_HaOG214514 [Helicoverpa armigera]
MLLASIFSVFCRVPSVCPNKVAVTYACFRTITSWPAIKHYFLLKMKRDEEKMNVERKYGTLVVLLWNKFELQTGEENNNGKESEADKNREQPETAFAVDNNESTESDEKMDLC